MKKLNLFLTLVALSLATSTLWADAPEGALKGVFTINSSCDMVYFSRGNLQKTGTWHFADNQYDYSGTSQSPKDMYTWPGSWDVAVDNGGNATGIWRCLSADEWTYIINTRSNSTVNGTSNARYTRAQINTGSTTVKGLIIFPDGYSGGTPSGVSWSGINSTSGWGTTCTKEGWEALEAAGCVFLPAAGYKDDYWGWSFVGDGGFYHSTTNLDGTRFRGMSFYNSTVTGQNPNGKSQLMSIRLVSNAPTGERNASVTTDPRPAENLVFDGNAHPLLETKGTAKNGTMKFSINGGSTWSDEIPEATEAGTYTVQYYAHKATNCYISSAVKSVDVTIAYAVSENVNPASVLFALYHDGDPIETSLLVNRTIYADGEYNTICLPFSLDETALAASPLAGKERLKAFKGATVTGSGQDLYIDIFVEDATAIEAGVPYLITFPAGSGNLTSLIFDGIQVTTTSPSEVSANGVTFRGIFGPTHIFTYEENTAASRNEDYLFVGSGSQLFWPNDDGSDMPGFRAYFIVDREAGSPISLAPKGTRARIMDAPMTTTGIDELNTTVCTKYIENGQLYIIKNGVKYNAQGAVVK